MCQVFFLGAGASKDAGYPLARGLLEELQFRKNEPIDIGGKQEYKKFKDFYDQIKNSESIEALATEDPEVFFTILDLWKGLKDTNLQRVIEKNKKLNISIEDENFWKNIADDKFYKLIETVENTMGSFSYLVDHYFTGKHYNSLLSNIKEIEYLQKGLSILKKGDAVITTNWDINAELILHKLGKWNPSNGYGFQKSLFTVAKGIKNSGRPYCPSKKILFPKSDITVLKLHGSIGWYTKSNEIYFRKEHYLDWFKSCTCLDFYDKNCPPSGSGPHTNPILLIPSYLKQVDNQILKSIWIKASNILNKAKVITFIGYSLPKADIGVRFLLASLKNRLKNNFVEIHIVDPIKKIENEWKDLLGEKIKFHEKTASDYFKEINP
jgi:hypothetical protein